MNSADDQNVETVSERLSTAIQSAYEIESLTRILAISVATIRSARYVDPTDNISVDNVLTVIGDMAKALAMSIDVAAVQLSAIKSNSEVTP